MLVLVKQATASLSASMQQGTAINVNPMVLTPVIDITQAVEYYIVSIRSHVAAHTSIHTGLGPTYAVNKNSLSLELYLFI